MKLDERLMNALKCTHRELELPANDDCAFYGIWAALYDDEVYLQDWIEIYNAVEDEVEKLDITLPVVHKL